MAWFTTLVLAVAALGPSGPVTDGLNTYDVHFVSSGVVLLVPEGWRRGDDGTWRRGDCWLVGGTVPAEAGTPAEVAAGMLANIEAQATVEVSSIEPVRGAGGAVLGQDLIVRTRGEGEAWQQVRVLEGAEGLPVLNARFDPLVKADLAALRSELTPCFDAFASSRATGGEDASALAFSVMGTRVSLPDPRLWVVLLDMWQHPQVRAAGDLRLAWTASGKRTAEEVLQAWVDGFDERFAGDRVQVVRQGAVDAVEGAHEAVVRVEHEPDVESELLRRLQTNVRWFRMRTLRSGGRVFALSAELNLTVTHPDDFIGNAESALGPLFDGWSVTPGG